MYINLKDVLENDDGYQLSPKIPVKGQLLGMRVILN